MSLPVKLANGTLRVEGYATRSGIFEYVTTDGGIRREWRPPDDALDATSLDTLRLVPVTLDHPASGLVDMSNMKTVRVGQVGDKIEAETTYPYDSTRVTDTMVKVRVTMIVDDPDAIAIIEAKTMRELSVGYLTDIEEVAGTTPGGERYDAIQRNVRFNHLAIVEEGRAGPAFAIRVDRKDTAAMTVKLNLEGVPFDAPEQTAAAVNAALAKRDGRILELETKVAEQRADSAKIEARADRAEADEKKAKAEAEAAKKAINEGVKARRLLERTALKVLGAAGESLDLDTLDDDALRIAVIKHGMPDMDIEGRSADYLAAGFDIAVKRAAAETPAPTTTPSVPTTDGKGGLLRANSTTAPVVLDPVAAARKEAAERQQNAWKPKRTA